MWVLGFVLFLHLILKGLSCVKIISQECEYVVSQDLVGKGIQSANLNNHEETVLLQSVSSWDKVISCYIFLTCMLVLMWKSFPV